MSDTLYTLLPILILSITFFITLPFVLYLTRNLTDLRKNFYRLIITHIFLSVLIFAQIGTIGIRRPEPVIKNDKLTLEEAVSNINELQLYSKEIENDVEYTTLKIYFLIGIMYLFSLIPLISLAFSFIKHLEKSENNEIERIL